jgi:hypothetical protein
MKFLEQNCDSLTKDFVVKNRKNSHFYLPHTEYEGSIELMSIKMKKKSLIFMFLDIL